ncbi:MAG: IS110 family transposase [Candidatus Sericytochromatia bacterium]
MNHLPIGIDVARRFHVASATQGKPFKFNNTSEGYQALLTWAHETAKERRPIFALEPTGHYHRLITGFLHREGYEVRLISGFKTKMGKALMFNSPNKTDNIDARVLAVMLEMGYGVSYQQPGNVFKEMRQLVDSHHYVSRNIVRTGNRLNRCLDSLFPELPLIAPLRSVAISELLQIAQTPQEILGMGYANMRRAWPCWSEKTIEKILIAAESSLGEYSPVMAAEAQQLAGQLHEFLRYERTLQNNVISLTAQIPYGKNLLTVPSVGTWLSASILGEIGDLREFPSARQVLKKAGLNMIEISSGEYQGRPHISRRGRNSLRGALYNAALQVSQKKHPLHGWYKEQLVKGGSQKKIFIAASRKLLRICHAVARDNQPFRLEMVGV